jgi:biopolymer transport protein ExbB/TolQ
VVAATVQEIFIAVLGTILGLHTAAIVALIAYLIRTREKVTRMEEWQRLTEKRLNSKT